MDPDKTAPEQSDPSPHYLQKGLLKSQADDKADDNCCITGSLRVNPFTWSGFFYHNSFHWSMSAIGGCLDSIFYSNSCI